MTCLPDVNFCFKRGETFGFTVNVTDANGLPVDLTGDTVAMVAKKNKSDASAVIDFTTLSAISITDAAAGEITVDLEPAGSANISAPVNLYYDIKLTKASGDVEYILNGNLEVKREVTS